MGDKLITVFFAKGKWVKDDNCPPALRELIKKQPNLKDNDLFLVRVLLDENDPAITGKSYYCDSCGHAFEAKLDNCPRCNSTKVVEGKITLEWVLSRGKVGV